MHGIIHSELKKYVETKYGSEVWEKLLSEVGLKHKIYLTVGTYPDEEAMTIVKTASESTNIPVDHILEDFGVFITPDLMKMYGSLIDPEWKSMEMLLHTEETIHRVVRMKNPGAKPPKLSFRKIGPNELCLSYASERQMSAVAKGIIKGVAKYYGEDAEIREFKKPDGSCEMTINIS